MEKLIEKTINNRKILFYPSELENIDENIDIISHWCKTRLLPYMKNKCINYKHNSYGLKHICEREVGFYVSNGQLKKVLAELNVKHYQSPDSPNCYYPIAESFYKQLSKQPIGDLYVIEKNKVKRISYKDDVDIIYTEKNFIVCQKNSIRDFGNNLAFIYDTKGKSDK